MTRPRARRLVALASSALVAAAAGAEPAEGLLPARELARQERERLARDEVVVEPLPPQNGEGVALRAIGRIDAPPEAVWPALRDCEDYAEFYPRTRESRLLERNPGPETDVAVCRVKIDLPFPLGELVSKTRVEERRLPDGGYERHWTLIEGNYDRIDGSWRLLPWGEGGTQTLAVYQVDFAPQTIIPDWVVQRTQAGTARGVFEALRKRVRKLSAPT